MDDFRPAALLRERILTGVKVALVLGLAAAMYLQLDVGMADQGDFLRATTWLTSGPVGLEKWSDPGNPERPKRFFYYYLPYWRYPADGVLRGLRNIGAAHTSTALLWAPGLLLNRLAYSRSVLYVPVLSLLPRLLLIGCVFGLFAWIERSGERRKLALHLLLGAPLVLLLSTTDYLAYLNSFYQEVGSMVFLFLWIASWLYLRRRRESLPRGLLCLAALMLLAYTKSSNVYWLPLGLPFILLLRYRWQWSARRMVQLAGLYAALTCGFLAACAAVARHPDYAGRAEYDSLFCGILTFSGDPSARLAELGRGDAVPYVGTKLHLSKKATDYWRQNQERLSFRDTLRVAWAEPAAMLRMLKFAADNMQDISVDDLGKRALGDPRARPAVVPAGDPPDDPASEVRYWDPASTHPLNCWSLMKFHVFPTGYAFLLTMAVYVAVFAALVRRGGFRGELAAIGLATSLACVADAAVAICGDGRCGLIKHLFLANLLFDCATLAMAGIVGLAVLHAATALRNRAAAPPTSHLEQPPVGGLPSLADLPKHPSRADLFAGDFPTLY